MNDLRDRLKAERARIWEEAKATLADAETEKRDLTGEEQEKWAKTNAALDELDARLDTLEARIAKEKVADERRAEFEALVRPDDDPAPAGESDEERVLAWARGEGPKGIEISLRGLKTVRHATGLWEVRDLTKSVAAAGGDTVPISFRRELMEHLIENSAIRRTNATVLTTASGEDLLIPKTLTHTTLSTITAEGTGIGESDPTFDQGTLQSFKYARLVQCSSELLRDTGVDLLGYLARSFGEALANGSGAHFVTGTGSSQPRGVITAGSVGVTGGTPAASGPTADELIDLYFSLIEPYRRNAYWLLRDATMAKIRKLKDSQNQYLWQPGLAGSMPNTLLDRPYVTDPNVPAVGSNATSVAFGDFSRYFIRDVGSLRFERSDEFAFNFDLVTYRAILHTDGDLLDETGAIKVYKGGTA